MDASMFKGLDKIIYALCALVAMLFLLIGGVAGGCLVKSCDRKAKEQHDR
jgi:hypothetical protein